MPLEYLKSCRKEDDAHYQQDQYGQRHLMISGALIENASYSVRQHCEGKVSYYRQAPVGEILIAEEYSGEYHHREYHEIDKSVSNLSV